MSILEQIIGTKKQGLAEARANVPVSSLEKSELFVRHPLSLTEFIRRKDKTGIIAEFKRKSPSKGILNNNATVEDTTRAYVEAGASGLSVLTDSLYFAGSNDDLVKARLVNQVPILRKDFIIDEYQIVEAKSIGADAILLIAAVLDPVHAQRLAAFARSLSLEVLLEVHDESELEMMAEVEVDLIGVNNRNLKTFEVSTETSKRLAPLIRKGVVKVSESGITDPQTIRDLRQHGFEGFLIGESFMKTSNPGEAAKEFMTTLKNTN